MNPEEIRLQWVMDLFQPAPDKNFPSETDPVMKVWSETAARFLREVGGMTIADLARRAGALEQFSP